MRTAPCQNGADRHPAQVWRDIRVLRIPRLEFDELPQLRFSSPGSIRDDAVYSMKIGRDDCGPTLHIQTEETTE